MLNEQETMNAKVYLPQAENFDINRLNGSPIVSNVEISEDQQWIYYEIHNLDSVQDYLPWCSQNDVSFELNSDTLTLLLSPSQRDSQECLEPYMYLNFHNKVKYKGPDTKKVKYLRRNHSRIFVPAKALKLPEVHYYYLER
jgi:hypothetical protein